jgi:hypothetical protein
MMMSSESLNFCCHVNRRTSSSSVKHSRLFTVVRMYVYAECQTFGASMWCGDLPKRKVVVFACFMNHDGCYGGLVEFLKGNCVLGLWCYWLILSMVLLCAFSS